ncbi:hypothetical protein Dsin_010202 [Dipteronia sinensis]|uniref:Protein kinase domain-containing protein n=1 Tax=Dipteronia sinensis TaxID=43782 RepID=A0AAE0ECU5_9ROSI|nr:hypothetical protein Dsin_010202 [Dipteronia sinensis]
MEKTPLKTAEQAHEVTRDGWLTTGDERRPETRQRPPETRSSARLKSGASVAEYMVDGSLRHVLVRKDRHLDRRKRLIIAMDAAFRMEYLHSKNIVHFDLKCDNLLVNLKDPSRPICKVGDFGLPKIKRNTLVSGGVRGTLPWMVPEMLSGSSSKVDVSSFGIFLWEILTGEEPYANYMHYGAIIEWKVLMEECWAPNPAVRPSFTEIARRLRVMTTAAIKAKAHGHKASK